MPKNPPRRKRNIFIAIANWTSRKAGHPLTFCLSFLFVLLWMMSGPFFGWSDTWQLIINSMSSVVTFLMVFLIQNSQNREGEAIQIKLDELIRANKSARNSLIDIEDLSQDDLDRLKTKFDKIALKKINKKQKKRK